jgi:hypothetical protein
MPTKKDTPNAAQVVVVDVKPARPSTFGAFLAQRAREQRASVPDRIETMTLGRVFEPEENEQPQTP